MEKGGKGRLLEGTFIVFADEGGEGGGGSALAAVRKGRGEKEEEGRRQQICQIRGLVFPLRTSRRLPPHPRPFSDKGPDFLLILLGETGGAVTYYYSTLYMAATTTAKTDLAMGREEDNK